MLAPQEVSRCCTRGESEEFVACASDEAQKSTLALKPRADITRIPEQGYQWSLKKYLCSQNIFFKKEEILVWLKKSFWSLFLKAEGSSVHASVTCDMGMTSHTEISKRAIKVKSFTSSWFSSHLTFVLHWLSYQ